MIGIGTDIVHIARIATMLEQHGERLPRRLLSKNEYQEYRQTSANKAAFIAKHFAAKEAVSKAMGTGIGQAAAFTDIEITHTPAGQPLIHFLGHAAETIQGLGAHTCHISISDEKDYAVAFAVLK